VRLSVSHTAACSAYAQRSWGSGLVSVSHFVLLRKAELTMTIAHFSENWGFLSLSPLLGGNMFSLAFGADLDAHATAPAPQPASSPVTSSSLPSPTSVSPLASVIHTATRLGARGGIGSDTQCLLGPACYKSSVRMTVAATTLALGLSIWAGVRDRRKVAAVEAEVAELLWDEREE
jgi:hypothetical protein